MNWKKLVLEQAALIEHLWARIVELEEFLKLQSHLHIDETSFKKNGKLQWAWCFVAEFFTFFKIDASRGSKVLHETLGDDFLAEKHYLRTQEAEFDRAVKTGAVK